MIKHWEGRWGEGAAGFPRGEPGEWKGWGLGVSLGAWGVLEGGLAACAAGRAGEKTFWTFLMLGSKQNSSAMVAASHFHCTSRLG